MNSDINHFDFEIPFFRVDAIVVHAVAVRYDALFLPLG